MVTDAAQAFVKLLDRSKNRVPLQYSTIEEIERAGCHLTLAYPTSKRPRNVRDGALMFIARQTQGPNDIRVFGRAIALRHVPERDDATAEDIRRRPWRQSWSRYIRVSGAKFVAGTMANGVSLNQLMDALEADSFRSTQSNAASGKGGNTDPHKAYQQQSAVELAHQAALWLGDRLEEAFQAHGKVPQDALDNFD